MPDLDILTGRARGEIVFEGEAGSEAQRWHWTHIRLPADAAAPGEGPSDLAEALLERDTLPRVSEIDDRTLVILRGINHDAGADPEDMISLRLAVGPERIVSVELRRLRQTDLMMEAFRAGQAPKSPGSFVRRLVDALRAEAEPVLDAIEDRLAALEQQVLAIADRGMTATQRRHLIDVRQDTIQLARFIGPQATALEELTRLKPDWLHDRKALREEAIQFRRIADDLEALRQRAQIVADEAARAAAERTNRIVLLLSVVSVVFLPLTFLTGLLGVNLGGIPGAADGDAFWLFTAILVAVGVVTGWVARRLLR